MNARLSMVLVFFALLLIAAAAYGQEPHGQTVTFAWGDFLSTALDKLTAIIIALAVAAWGVLAVQLPAWTKPLVYTLRVEQLILRAVQSALARAKDTLNGKEISIDISEPIIADAVNYILVNGADTVLDFMGTDLPSLIERVLARMKAEGVAVPGVDPATVAENIQSSVQPYRPPGV